MSELCRRMLAAGLAEEIYNSIDHGTPITFEGKQYHVSEFRQPPGQQPGIHQQHETEISGSQSSFGGSDTASSETVSKTTASAKQDADHRSDG